MFKILSYGFQYADVNTPNVEEDIPMKFNIITGLLQQTNLILEKYITIYVPVGVFLESFEKYQKRYVVGSLSTFRSSTTVTENVF